MRCSVSHQQHMGDDVIFTSLSPQLGTHSRILRLLVLEIARKAGHLPLGTLDRELSKLEGTERV